MGKLQSVDTTGKRLFEAMRELRDNQEMGIAEHYTYRVRWSAEDGEYIATVVELPSLSWLAADKVEAFAGIQDLAAAAVEDILADGEQPPG